MQAKTLASVALECATQLGRVNDLADSITDLEPQIHKQIAETIRYHSRRPWHMTERRNMTLTLVPEQRWYSTVTSGLQVIPVRDILGVDYIREADQHAHHIRPMSLDEFERWHELSAPGGPDGYVRYGDEIGIYPSPSEVGTIEIFGQVKPTIPVNPGDESVWFTEAEDVIVAGTNKRVCMNYLRDPERGQEFAIVEQGAIDRLHSEYIRKSSTGRLRVHE